mmetsp:Transcript_15070/g.21144  ORF Transcript_15070/g.21144 Transcript_15070/m.21144 type:complete len:150 (-) Transcript_15070:22-471(-)
MNVTEVKFEDSMVVATGLNDGLTRLIKYHSLIIATGARAKSLEEAGVDSGGFKNIHYVRTASDISGLRNDIEHGNHRPCGAKDACVIGGGYIGTEVASYLYEHGYNTTIVHKGTNLLSTFLPDEIAFRYTQLYRKFNITVILNVGTFLA